MGEFGRSRPSLHWCVGAISLAIASTFVATAEARPSGGALAPVTVDALTIVGEFGVPEDSLAIVATLTAVEPTEATWMRMYACDADPSPTTASLSSAAGAVTNNLVLSRIADDDTVCVATRAVTDYVVDLVGFVPAGSPLTPLDAPTRILDTRDGTGGTNPSPVPDGATVEVQIAGVGDAATDASAAVLNLTAVGGSLAGRVTAHPCDREPSLTSSVNYAAGHTVANLVVARLDDVGRVCLTTKHASDLVVDLVAFAAEGLDLLPAPRRILDTRNGDAGPIPAGSTTEVAVGENAGTPLGDAALYNLATVDGSSRGYVVAHDCDDERPLAATRNHAGPSPVSVLALTHMSRAESICVFNRSATHLTIDLIGTVPASTITAVAPVRIRDTRDGGTPCDWLTGHWLLGPPFELSNSDFRTTLTALNVATQERFTVPHPPLPAPNGLPTPQSSQPIISADCTAMLYAAPDRRLYRFGFDGTTTSTPLGARPSQFSAIQELVDGRLVGAGLRIVDLETGDDLGPGGAQISRSGTLVVDGQADVFFEWVEMFDRAGELIGSSERQSVVSQFSPSFDGRHVAISWNSPNGTDPRTTIVNTAGEEVVIGPPGIETTWLGGGWMVTCDPAVGVWRWHLFDDPADRSLLPGISCG